MSEIIRIRLNKGLREAMEKVDIDWEEEIVDFIRRKIREHLKKVYLEKARKIRERLPRFKVSNAELIREDRGAF